MTMSRTAVRTARHNLVQRIERFLKRIQTEGFQPGPDTLANFEVALDCLERGDYPGGEDSMIWGEHRLRAAFSTTGRAASDWQAHQALRAAAVGGVDGVNAA